MLAAGVVGRVDRRLGDAVLRGDDEGQHAAQGNGAALLTDRLQALSDLTNGRIGQINDHGRLQTRPSRASSASAEGGPHEPGEYCSTGPVCAAQYSSTGS